MKLVSFFIVAPFIFLGHTVRWMSLGAGVEACRQAWNGYHE